MTQNETIWLLVGIIQFGVIGFVSYWTRRVQHLEDTITKSIEERTRLLVEFQGRVSVLEARSEAQFTSIMETLTRIEKRLDRNEEE